MSIISYRKVEYVKFLTSSILGVIFFLFPVNYNNHQTVVFDIFVKQLLQLFGNNTGLYIIGLIMWSIVVTIKNIEKGNLLTFLTKVIGLILSLILYLSAGPDFILQLKNIDLL